MPATSRIGDLGAGVCYCHRSPIPMVGMLITGDSSVYTENSPTSRVGDIVLGFCGHIGVMIAGSSGIYSTGRAVVRTGDPFVGCFVGVLITGASSVITGEQG
jgi:uncharacterized Zn-binding protein involved in type VI secretion